MQVLISSAKYDSTNNPKLTCYFQKTFSKYGVILNVFPVNKSVIGHYLYQTLGVLCFFVQGEGG